MALPVTSGLLVDLDASAITGKSDTDAISQWDDSSGNGNHATQASGTKQPAYRTNMINGRPAVRFDGSNDRLTLTWGSTQSQPNTVVLVARALSVPTDSRPFVDGVSTTSARHYVGINGDYAGGEGFVKPFGMFAGSWVWWDDATTDWVLIVAEFNGSSSELHVGPDLHAAASSNPGSQGSNGLSIGARQDDAQFLNCDIARILFYNRELTAAEKHSLVTYLNETYSDLRVKYFGSLSGSSKWAYADAAYNGAVYCAPSHTSAVLKVDPILGESSTFGSLGSGEEFKWIGAVKAKSGKVYFITGVRDTVLVVDPSDDSTSEITNTLADGYVNWYRGILAPNGHIYGIPFTYTRVLKINTSTDSVSLVGSSLAAGNNKWGGGVLVGDKIYCVPRDSTAVLKIDTSNDTTSTFGSVSADTRKWAGGLLVGDKIYCTPRNATSVLVIDTSADTVSTPITGLPSGDDKWNGECLGDDGLIYMFPRDRTDVLVIDPSDDSYELRQTLVASPRASKWAGSASYRGRTVSVPFDSQVVMVWDFSQSTGRRLASNRTSPNNRWGGPTLETLTQRRR